MPRHPDPHIRRAIRVLATVGELHKRGYQKLRVMPFMSPSGMHWRCWIAPAMLFCRNHGAVLFEKAAAMPDEREIQSTSMVARYTSGQDNQYFGWTDAAQDDARLLADKLIERFAVLATCGKGWDYVYAGWYQRLLGLAEDGWLPVVMSDYDPVSFDRITLDDMRPADWCKSGEELPVLPLPPPGESQHDYPG